LLQNSFVYMKSDLLLLEIKILPGLARLKALSKISAFNII